MALCLSKTFIKLTYKTLCFHLNRNLKTGALCLYAVSIEVTRIEFEGGQLSNIRCPPMQRQKYSYKCTDTFVSAAIIHVE